jgi:hypothetical protein
MINKRILKINYTYLRGYENRLRPVYRTEIGVMLLVIYLINK